MTYDQDALVASDAYGDGLTCRGTRRVKCPLPPVWEIWSGNDGKGQDFSDWVCGRHLPTFLADYPRDGEWFTLFRLKRSAP